MRHGNGFNSWWKQERRDCSCTQCPRDTNILNGLVWNSQNHFFCQYVSIYVKTGNEEIDKWRLKFFESMGGKSHVKCNCCNFPLIPSNKGKEGKRQCCLKHFFQGDNSIVKTSPRCSRKESFVCSNINCNMIICRKCYKQFPENNTTIVIPECNDQDT